MMNGYSQFKKDLNSKTKEELMKLWEEYKSKAEDEFGNIRFWEPEHRYYFAIIEELHKR